MVNRYIKNIDTVDHTYQGQVITAGAYYLIQPLEYVLFSSSSDLLTDIGSSKAQMAKTNDGSSDISDINEQVNYLKGIDIQKDTDGALLSRTKIAPSGWHYQSLFMKLTTSSGVIYSKDKAIADLGHVTVTRYDDQDAVTTTDANVVKTVFDFEPTFDQNILGAKVWQKTEPTTPLYLYVEGAPHIPKASGGQVEFCEGGMDLSYMGTGQVIHLDGKVPKRINYDATFHSGKLEFTLIHDVGLEHTIMAMMRMYKPSGV